MESQKILIQVRFAPDGSTVEISERPKALTPHEWFNALSEKAGGAYQALSGGRGVFRLTTNEIEALRAAVTPATA